MTFGLLAGCQTGGTDSGENKGGEKTESGKDSGKTKIAFIPQLVGIPYFSAMEKGGERAAEDLGNQHGSNFSDCLYLVMIIACDVIKLV